MTTLRLERFGRNLDATWGRLYCSTLEDYYFTVEPPWNFNMRFESCILDGTYDLVRHNSQQHPGSWAMIGEGISHREQAGVARYACLIHAANWAWELDGCIAPGTSLEHFERGPAVANSRRALNRIDAILRAAEEPRIEIVSPWG